MGSPDFGHGWMLLTLGHLGEGMGMRNAVHFISANKTTPVCQRPVNPSIVGPTVSMMGDS